MTPTADAENFGRSGPADYRAIASRLERLATGDPRLAPTLREELLRIVELLREHADALGAIHP